LTQAFRPRICQGPACDRSCQVAIYRGVINRDILTLSNFGSGLRGVLSILFPDKSSLSWVLIFVVMGMLSDLNSLLVLRFVRKLVGQDCLYSL